MDLNIVILEGKVIRDPEAVGESGRKFTIRNVRGFGDKVRVCFFNCVAFGKLAETVKKYVYKDKLVIVRGEVKITEKDGKYYTDIWVSELYLKGSSDETPVDRMGTRTESAPPVDLPVHEIPGPEKSGDDAPSPEDLDIPW